MKKLATLILTFALGAALAVFVAGSATAAGSKTTTAKQTTTSKTKTKSKSKSKSKTKTKTKSPTTTVPDSPATHFMVVNGTADAASDHEIVGSSAFPNFTTGAVDNYYSKAHAHVDNAPFAQGTASPADTGPVGQTIAAGNFQQPQYADARWPGDPSAGKASYGSQGGPFATATADEYNATADASEASNDLNSPGMTGAPTLAVPKGFDLKLRDALAGWKSAWEGRLTGKKKPPAITTPVGTVPLPSLPKPPVAPPKVTKPKISTPSVTTPVATVSTPQPDTGSGTSAPPVTVPSTSLPTVGAMGPSRSLASGSSSPDGETGLTSSTLAKLDEKTYTLITSGESSLARVTLGGGQIVIKGIHVSASITNDGTPSYKAAVSVASATIGGVPVTIDQDGVHVAGQGAGLPFQKASDALNTALKQAGIQIFLVAPEVTLPCGQSSTGTGAGGTTTGSSTTDTRSTSTDSGDQSSTTNSACAQSGSSSGCGMSGGDSGPSGPSLPTLGGSPSTTSSNNQTDTTSCDQTDTTSCGGSGTTTNNSTTTTGGITGIGPGTSTNRTTTNTSTTKSSTNRTGTTTTTSSGCDQSGSLPPLGTCSTGSTGTTPTTTTGDAGSGGSALNPFDPSGLDGASNQDEETVRATGVHVVFTQPVSASGMPAQYAEHILGEVYVDSLAVPAGRPPKIDLLGLSSPSSSSPTASTSSSSSCGGKTGTSTAGGASSAAAGGSTAGGSSMGGSASTGSGSLSGGTAGTGSTFGLSSQPGSGGSTMGGLPAAFASALKKPLWLLVAYLIWQALVIGTGASLWNWRRDEAP